MPSPASTRPDAPDPMPAASPGPGPNLSRLVIVESAPALTAIRGELWHRLLWPAVVVCFGALASATLAGDLLRRIGTIPTPSPPWWGFLPGLGVMLLLLVVSGGHFLLLRSRWRIGSRGITIRGNRWATLRWPDVADGEIRYRAFPATAPMLSIARRRRWPWPLGTGCSR